MLIENFLLHDAVQRALEFSDVTLHCSGDRMCNLFRELYISFACFCIKDCDTRFKIRRLNIRDHTSLKTGSEPILQFRNRMRRAIRRKHNLRTTIGEFVERMEKFLLAAFLSSNKLDIVNQQNVYRAVRRFEPFRGSRLDRRDQIPNKALRRNIANLEIGRVFLKEMITDCL